MGHDMNLLELGAVLKRERERQGLSVRDIMDATKISRRNLIALEDGDVAALPHPVYLKGYVRNYARLVGLEPDALVDVVESQHDGDGRYLPQTAQTAQVAPPTAAFRAPAGVPTPETAPAVPPAPASEPAAAKPEPESAKVPEPERMPLTAPAPEPAPEEPAPLRLGVPEPLGQAAQKKQPGGLAVVALLMLVAVLAGLIYQYQRLQGDDPKPAPPAAVATNATATPAAGDNATASAVADNATKAEPAAQEPQAAPSASAAGSGEVSGEPLRTPGDPNTKSVPTSSIEVSRKAQAAPQAAPVAAPAQPRTPGAQVLTITAKPKEVCWAGVYDGDKLTASFLLRDGESRQVEIPKRARLRLGNAGGTAVQLNGAPYPFEGARGQKVTLEFGTR
jgi:cytoskeleton protein RodZ